MNIKLYGLIINLNYMKYILLLILLTSCGSKIRVDLNKALSFEGNELRIEAQNQLNISETSFDVELNFSNDQNSNSSATFYFCNETDSPGCDPLGGTSLAMTKLSSKFTANISALTSPNDPGDIIKYLIVAIDSDGVVGASTPSQLILSNPDVNIFRSIGPGNTSILDSFATGTMTISAGVATFLADIALNVGVGDVVVYNGDANIAVINSRIDARNYRLRNIDGVGAPANIVANGDWKIFRAYTSLANAETGSENTGIPIGVRDFDTWSVGRDIVAAKEKWNFALYGDNADSRFTLTGWTTSSLNSIKIFSPYLTSEVGISQRHTGKWSSTKARIVGSNTDGTGMIQVLVGNVSIEGIQVENTANLSTDFVRGINLFADGDFRFSENIIRCTGGGTGANNESGITLNNSTTAVVNILNNIISGFGTGIFHDFFETFSGAVYNNTFVNNGVGVYLANTAIKLNIHFKNNISINSSVADYTLVNPESTSNNISSDGSSPDGAGFQNKTVAFVDLSNGDYRLTSSDTSAKGLGADLSADLILSFNTDAKKLTRFTWDIGALNFLDSSGYTSWNEDGEGTLTSPYLLGSKAQFKDVGITACNSSSSLGCSSAFKILENIDLNNEAFTPIGDNTNQFTGNFNGNSKTISNLFISSANDTGLFGVACGANISNIIISGVNITGNDFVGALVGRMPCGGATVNNCSSINGTVVGRYIVGGLVGYSLGGGDVISNSNSSVDVSASTTFESHGGLVGRIQGTTISSSYASGNVTGNFEVGGLVGSAPSGATITSSYSLGNVTGAGVAIGGLIGIATNSTFTSVYAKGNVVNTSGIGDYVGGLIGSLTGTGSVTDSYALGDVRSAGNSVGGFIGQSTSSGTISNSWAGGDVKSSGTTNGGFIGYNTSNINDSFSLGNVNSIGNTTGGFVGSHDTRTISRSYSTGNVDVIGGDYVGGFAGYNSDVISNSYATGNVYTDRDHVGGFVGLTDGGSNISQSFSNGNVHGRNTIGGFVGNHFSGPITTSYTLGKISGSSDVGGFVGEARGTSSITNSYNKNDVFGVNVGGFVGLANTTTLTNNYSSSRVSGSTSQFAFINTLTAATMTDNYWDSDLVGGIDGSDVGASAANDYEPYTSIQMQDNGSFASWDYAGTWTQLDLRATPVHKNSPEGKCIDNPTAALHTTLGSGTLADPYILCNTTQFKDFANNGCDEFGSDNSACSASLVLGADIDLKKTANTKIGSTNFPFAGVFDGNGHRISNYYYNNPASFGYGLFHRVSGVIQNLEISNSYLDVDYYSGILLSESKGAKIINVKGSGVVKGNYFLGGLISLENNSNTTIIHGSEFTGHVDTGYTSGGIMGSSSLNTNIYKNSFYGIIDGSAGGGFSLGGIIGRGMNAVSNSRTNIVSKSKAFGEILAGTRRVASIAGQILKVDKSFTSMNITADDNEAGGITGGSDLIENSFFVDGNLDGAGTGRLGGVSGNSKSNYSYAINTFSNFSSAGGILGQSGTSSNFQYNFWDTTVSGNPDATAYSGAPVVNSYEGKTSADMLLQATYATWDFTNTWAIGNAVRPPMLRWDLHPICQANMSAAGYNSIGAGTRSNPYKICFKEQLKDISVSGCDVDSSAGCSSYYELMNDIDLKNVTYFPIGVSANRFGGVFNGNNHTISNLKLSTPGDDRIGLFGYVNGGDFYNLKLKLFDIEGRGRVGLLAGNLNSSTVDNVHVNGVLKGNSAYIGGISGENSNSTIQNSSAHVDITMPTPSIYVGGITGLSFDPSLIFNTFATGSISNPTGDYVGGLVGDNRSKIYDSWSNVNITAGSSAGGLIGNNSTVTSDVKSSYSLGNTSGNTNVGGFVGASSDGSISDCYSHGAVVATGNYGGGFVGVNSSSTISNSYATGVPSGALIKNGGFVGQKSAGVYVNNYWNSDNFADADSAGEYEGLTNSEMANSANFTGWNFTTIWRVFTGDTPEIIQTND